MKICDCIKCGGTDDSAFCENAMMDAWVDYHRSKHRFEWLLFVTIALFILIFCRS